MVTAERRVVAEEEMVVVVGKKSRERGSASRSQSKETLERPAKSSQRTGTPCLLPEGRGKCRDACWMLERKVVAIARSFVWFVVVHVADVWLQE